MSLKNEFKDFKSEVEQCSRLVKILIVGMILFILAGVGFFGWCLYDMKKNPEKYEQATQERAVAEQEYNERHTYEVISIEEYIKITTNQYGAVTDQNPAYSIWYKDTSKSGGVDLIEGIEFHEYGIHKMSLGDKDTITFRQDGGITVRLTEEAMRGM